MKFYDVDNNNNNLINANNTDEEVLGSGSDGKAFDPQFGKKKNKVVNWTFEGAK
jgi:hypothetical protein